MEEEDFKFIEYKTRKFKCFRDGRCFMFSLNQWRECLCRSKQKRTFVYRVNLGNNKFVKIHRLLGYAFLGLDIENPKLMIDHMDGNGLNNKFNNIRVVDNETNSRNNHYVKGVSIHSGGGFDAYIGQGKTKQRKYFKTEEAALKWRHEKEIELGYLTRATGCST